MARRAALTPEAPYFHLYGETVTYGRLWAQSGRYAGALAKAGVGPGNKVCLIYPTCAEFFYTFFGALRLGAVPVPLYPTLGVEANFGNEWVRIGGLKGFVDGSLGSSTAKMFEPYLHEKGNTGVYITPPGKLSEYVLVADRARKGLETSGWR